MAINKVIDRNNNVLIDLTHDTVSPHKVLEGEVFHDSNGEIKIGTMKSKDDSSKYRFYDYDGTLMYSYTDEELDNLTELPAGPDHTDENLTFQEWNWTLEELKNVRRNRPDRPIVGPSMITTDGVTYLKIKIRKSAEYIFNIRYGYNYTYNLRTGEKYEDTFEGVPAGGTYHYNGTLTIEWGDGTENFVETRSQSINTKNITHYYEKGTYDIKISSDCPYFLIGGGYNRFGGSYTDYLIDIVEAKVGDCIGFSLFSNSRGDEAKGYIDELTKVNIPKDSVFAHVAGQYLKFITVPRDFKSTDYIGTSSGYFHVGGGLISIISLPNNMTCYSYSLSPSYPYCFLNGKYFYIPDSYVSMWDNCTKTSHKYFSFNSHAEGFLPLELRISSLPSRVSLENDILYAGNNSLTNFIKGNADGIFTKKIYISEKCAPNQFTSFSQSTDLSKCEEIVFHSTCSYVPKPDSMAYNTKFKFYNLTKIPNVVSIDWQQSSGYLRPFTFIVPDNLVDSYKNTVYWSNMAENILGESEVVR